MTDLNPSRIEWRRDGYVVWADEDGVHINTGARGFEMPEALAMVELYQAVLAHYRTGEPFPKPTVPPRDRRTNFPDSYTARRVQRVADAINAEFAHDTDIVAF